MNQTTSPEAAGLSSFPRGAMAAAAAAFGLLGLLLFVAPTWAAASFAWKVSPFVAMTMGGWYLGSAAMAGLVAYHRRWNLIYATALYVGTFSLSELLVLGVHSARLRLDAPLVRPYIAILALALLASLLVLLDAVRQRARVNPQGLPAPAWVRGIAAGFALFVFFLAGVAFRGHWVGLNGGIFPEPLTPFTLRSFGAFYFSLGVASLAFLRVRHLAAVTVHVSGGLCLIALITAAALVYYRAFDLAAHPFQVLYPGVYLGALGAALYYLGYVRVRRS